MLQTSSQTRSDTHGKFIWCELMTSDTQAAGRFYGDVIGWWLSEMAMGTEGPPYFIFQIGQGEGCPGIGGMMSLPPHLAGHMPPNWSGYVAVDDVDATAAAFRENGGTVHRRPEDIQGVGRFAVVADPDGAVINIMTPLPMEDMPASPPKGAPGTTAWYELYAGDLEASFDFYSGMFGWTQDHDFDMGAMGPYRIFAEHGEVIGGMMRRPQGVPVPSWVYYFNVDGIDDALDRVRRGGGKVLMDASEVPGGSWAAQCLDPHGALFGLVSARR